MEEIVYKVMDRIGGEIIEGRIWQEERAVYDRAFKLVRKHKKKHGGLVGFMRYEECDRVAREVTEIIMDALIIKEEAMPRERIREMVKDIVIKKGDNQ